MNYSDSHGDPDYERWDMEDERDRLIDQKDELREALDTLVAIVGLTAIKYEEQRSVLQEAMDKACEVLRRIA